jgi:hypothetical protein
MSESHKPAPECGRRLRSEPTEQEPTSDAEWVACTSVLDNLLLGDQGSHVVGADCPLEDDR